MQVALSVLDILTGKGDLEHDTSWQKWSLCISSISRTLKISFDVTCVFHFGLPRWILRMYHHASLTETLIGIF